MKEYGIRYRSLSNDVRHLEIAIPHRETASCVVFVKTGSRNEKTKKEAGISHALEHKIYCGSKRRSGHDRGLAVDRLGSDESAFTEKEYTSYYIDLESSRVPKALALLSEVFVNPTFPRGLLNLENNVLVGEIADYSDDYGSNVLEEFEGLLFDKTDMAKPILGTKSSVLSHTRKELKGYMKKWYRGGNVLVVLEGKVNRTGKLVEKYFSRLPSGPIQEYTGTAGFGKPGNRVVTIDTNQAYFVLGVPGVSLGSEDHFTMRMIEVILGGHQILDDRTIQSSRLFEEVRNKRGMAYDISTFTFSGSDIGYLAIQGLVQPRNFRSTLDLVQKELFGLAETVTREEVSRAKIFMQHYLKRQLETPHKAGEIIGLHALLYDKVQTPVEMFEKIEAVNLKKVRNLAEKLLVPEQARLALLGPFDQNLKRVSKGNL